MTFRGLRKVLFAACASVLLLAPLALAPATLSAEEFSTKGFGGRWTPAGPTPVLGGQVENVVPDGEVDGAIHTVAAHPTDPNTLWPPNHKYNCFRIEDFVRLPQFHIYHSKEQRYHVH